MRFALFYHISFYYDIYHNQMKNAKRSKDKNNCNSMMDNHISIMLNLSYWYDFFINMIKLLYWYSFREANSGIAKLFLKWRHFARFMLVIILFLSKKKNTRNMLIFICYGFIAGSKNNSTSKGTNYLIWSPTVFKCLRWSQKK